MRKQADEKLYERWLDATRAMETLPWDEVQRDLKIIRAIKKEQAQLKTTAQSKDDSILSIIH